MATERIVIQTDQLEKTNTHLEELLSEVRAQLSALYEVVQEQNSMWEGPANLAFQQQFAADEQTAMDLCDVLRGFLQSMRFARSSYDQCEKQLLDVIRQIRI